MLLDASATRSEDRAACGRREGIGMAATRRGESRCLHAEE